MSNNSLADVTLEFAETASTSSSLPVATIFSFIKSKLGSHKTFKLQNKKSTTLVRTGKSKKEFTSCDVSEFQLEKAPYLLYDDTRGTLFLSCEDTHVIYGINVSTGRVDVVAGRVGFPGHADGALLQSKFKAPRSMRMNAQATAIYLSDNGNHVIRKIDLQRGVVTTLCGSPGANNSTPDIGPALSIKLSYPNALVVDKYENVFFHNSGTATVKRISPQGIVTNMNLQSKIHWLSSMTINPDEPHVLYVGNREPAEVIRLEMDPETHSRVIATSIIQLNCGIENIKNKHTYGIVIADKKLYVNQSPLLVIYNFEDVPRTGKIEAKKESAIQFASETTSLGDLTINTKDSCLYVSHYNAAVVKIT